MLWLKLCSRSRRRTVVAKRELRCGPSEQAIADKHFCAIAVENASLARDTAVVFVELSADTQGCAAVKRRLAKWIRLWRDCRDLWGSRWSEGGI